MFGESVTAMPSLAMIADKPRFHGFHSHPLQTLPWRLKVFELISRIHLGIRMHEALHESLVTCFKWLPQKQHEIQGSEVSCWSPSLKGFRKTTHPSLDVRNCSLQTFKLLPSKTVPNVSKCIYINVSNAWHNMRWHYIRWTWLNMIGTWTASQFVEKSYDILIYNYDQLFLHHSSHILCIYGQIRELPGAEV